MEKQYDSRPDTVAHIKRVGELIDEFCRELQHRAYHHDASKLGLEEKPLFDEMTPRLKGTTYGSEEYRQSLTKLKPALDHHYANNSHHPEHYKNGIDDMDLADIVEMFFDWKAASERHADGSIEKSIKINTHRFSMTGQLANIFHNTVQRMFAK